MERIIFGIVGYSGSGKDVVSDILQKHGFVPIRLSDAIRKYAEENRIKIKNTNDLVNLGNWLREISGPDILPRLVAQSMEFKHADKIVINGIRNPAEVDYLHEYHEAVIAGIIITEEKLISNILGRKREGDPVDRDGVIKMLAREKGADGNTGMDIEACLKKTDIRISNIGSKFDLEYEVAKNLSILRVEGVAKAHESHGHNHER